MKRCIVFFIGGIFYSFSFFGQSNLQLKKIGDNIKKCKQIKEYFVERSSTDDFRKKANQMILGELPLDYFSKDSLVFVEMYGGLESSGLSSSIYESGTSSLRTYYVQKKFPLELKKIKNKKYLSEYIIEEIRKGNLVKIKEEGDKSTLHPESYVYITIAVSDKNEYKIESYTTKFFIPKKNHCD